MKEHKPLPLPILVLPFAFLAFDTLMLGNAFYRIIPWGWILDSIFWPLLIAAGIGLLVMILRIKSTKYPNPLRKKGEKFILYPPFIVITLAIISTVGLLMNVNDLGDAVLVGLVALGVLAVGAIATFFTTVYGVFVARTADRMNKSL